MVEHKQNETQVIREMTKRRDKAIFVSIQNPADSDTKLKKNHNSIVRLRNEHKSGKAKGLRKFALRLPLPGSGLGKNKSKLKWVLTFSLGFSILFWADLVI